MTAAWTDNACLEAAAFAAVESDASQHVPRFGSPHCVENSASGRLTALWPSFSHVRTPPASPIRDPPFLDEMPQEANGEQMQLLAEAMRRLCEQVKAQEDRHVSIDRRLVQVDSQLQVLHEEQELQCARLRHVQGQIGESPMSHTPTNWPSAEMSPVGDGPGRLQALEKGQRAVAAAVQRAMQLALNLEESHKVLAARMDAYRGGGVESAIQAAGRASHDAHMATEKIDRVSRKVEEQQQAQSCLEQQFEQQQRQLAEFKRSFEGLVRHDVSLDVLRQRLDHHEKQLAEKSLQGCPSGQDASLDALKQRLEEHAKQLAEFDASIADLQSTAAAQTLFGAPQFVTPDAQRDSLKDEGKLEDFEECLKGQAASVTKLRAEINELHVTCARANLEAAGKLPTPRAREPEAEAAPAALAASPLTKPEALAAGAVSGRLADSCMCSASRNLEIHMEAGLEEVRRNLDEMQQTLDETVLVQLRRMAQQVPEALGRLERLGKQCAECLAKTESHEVRLDLTRAGLETQEERLQGLSERLNHTSIRNSSFANPATHTGLPSTMPSILACPAELRSCDSYLANDTHGGMESGRDRPVQPGIMQSERDNEKSNSLSICANASCSSSRSLTSLPRHGESSDVAVPSAGDRPGDGAQLVVASQLGWKDTSGTSRKLDDICAKLRLKSVDKTQPATAWPARDGRPGPGAPPRTPQLSPQSSPRSSSLQASALTNQKQAEAKIDQSGSTGQDQHSPQVSHGPEIVSETSQDVKPCIDLRAEPSLSQPLPSEEAQESTARGRTYSCCRREALEAAALESDEPFLPFSRSPSGRNRMTDFTGY